MILVIDRVRIWKTKEPLQAIGYSVKEEQIKNSYIFLKKILAMAFGKFLNREKIDVIVCDSSTMPLIIGVLSKKICKKPLIVKLKGDIVTEYDNIIRQRNVIKSIRCHLQKKFFLTNVIKADSIIVVSSYLKKQLQSIMNANNIYVCPTPVKNISQPKVEKNDKLVMLTVSNFNFIQKTKIYTEIIEELDLLFKKYKNIYWYIVGDGKYAYLLKKLKEKFDDRVILYGYRKDVSQFYKEADIFMYFSRLDAYPSVILEAQSHGLPVITNKGFGMSDQVFNDINGYLIDITKYGFLYSVISKLIIDSELRLNLGFNSCKIIQQNNSMKGVGDYYDKIIKEIKNIN